MTNRKKVFMGILGAVFLLLGFYYEPVKSDIAYKYLGIGTWAAGIIFYTLYPKYKEIASFIIGLLVLHAGVLLLLKELTNPKLLGFLVFTSGIVFVLNSGFSEFIKKRKMKKKYKQIPY